MFSSIKSFVLDTNILLLDSRAMLKFEENEVHIPMVVLEELDKFKKDMDEKGFNARAVARFLDALCDEGNLTEGIELPNGGKIFVKATDLSKAPRGLDTSINDNIIIAHAIETGSILVSKDVNVRLKARALEVPAEDFEPSEIRDMDTVFKGHREVILNAEQAHRFKNGTFELRGEMTFSANEYAWVKEENSSNSRLCRYHKDEDALKAIINRDNVIGLKPANKEQRFALDALMDPSIQLVTLQGKAGTGKTLLAVAASLSQVLDGDDLYKKLSISRPIQPMGKDLGFLPGTVEEKLAPWMKPIFDNIEYLFEENTTKGNKTNSKQTYSVEQMMEQGFLEMEAITYIRGRSMPFQLIIVDEAQNLSSHEIKTILTRAGEGTKIILTGDVEQIDTPYLDKLNNGFAYVIQKFKDEKIAAHITLEKGERSLLAELASNLL